jgi:ornithine carbamoyltransferase
MRHFLQFNDLSAAECAYVFERAALIKKKFKAYEKHHSLVDRTLAMIFEKASTRTRVSFEAGMYQLGGSVVHLTTGDSQLGRAEPIEDSAKVISRMVDLVMIRTYEQTKLERFAANSRVPVINGLTNEFHPCQILADIFTYIEHRGSIRGKTVAWVGCKRPICWASKSMSAHPVAMRSTNLWRACAGLRATRCSKTRWTLATKLIWSPPMCGPAWVLRPKTRCAK